VFVGWNERRYGNAFEVMDDERARYAAYDGEASYRIAHRLVATRPSSSSLRDVELVDAEQHFIRLGLL
jgi:hypothetical protein